MRFANPIDYLTNSVGDRLPPEVLSAFVALGNAQRYGANSPEQLMVQAQHALGGGVLNFVIEHVGDIPHRMTHMLGWNPPNDGYEYVENKVAKTLVVLRNAYGFEREHKQNMANNAKYYKIPLAEYMTKVNATLTAYANAHAKLPVYNRAQYMAREAAVALGQQNFYRAELYLSGLERMLKTEESWWAAATTYKLDASGRPMLYEPAP